MTAQTRQKTERAEESERFIRDMLCAKRKEEGRGKTTAVHNSTSASSPLGGVSIHLVLTEIYL